MASVPFFEFVSVPVNCFKILGRAILEPRRNQWLLKMLLYIGVINYNIQWGLQVVYIILSIQSSEFVDAFTVAPCVGFGFVGNLKLITLHMNTSSIENILKEFEDIYPKTVQLQKDYKLGKHLRNLKPVMIFYAFLNIFNAFYFPCIPVLKSIYAVVIEGMEYDFPLIFPIWYPFDPSNNWLVYLVTTIGLLYAGFLAAIAYSTADLFLVSSLAQLCMHFDYTSIELERFQPSPSGNFNVKFIKEIIKHHTKCLNLNVFLERIFGFSLLCNFIASSGTICFVGFQVTSATFENLIQNIVLLVTSLVQVLIVCIYGNRLIDSSQSVGMAAFGHPWYMCNIKYKKMVWQIIARSQKFAAIHAPTFPPISLQTFMKVISMSYQFFAVLETISGRK